MKIQIFQENLLKALNTAGRSISSKAQLPILANVLLSTENNRLKVSATNLETGVNIWTGAKIEKEGSITLPSKILQEYVSSLPAEKISLEVKENIANLTSTSFNASFNGLAASEFPVLPKGEKKIFSFQSSVLIEVINRVAFASASDEGRPILTGVSFKKEGKTLTLAATDGYRLSVEKVEVAKISTEGKDEEELRSLVIPAKTLLEVSRIVSEQVKQDQSIIEMSLTKDGNQAVFSFPEIELSTRLLEGDFPDYEKIVPQEASTTVTLDKEELLRAIRTASIFARDSANIVKFKFQEGKAVISANSPQVGENISEIGAKTEGGEAEIAFNFRFLLDFLAAVKEGEVSLEMTGSLNPGLFKIKGKASYLHVIMPVRLQS